MSNLFYIYIFLIFILNEVILRKNFFFDRIQFSKHKSFVNSKKIPTAGGVFLLSFMLIFFKNLSFLSFFYLLLIFLAGLGSDRVKNFSPKLRLLFQIVLTYLFLIDNNLLINDVRIGSINFLLINFEEISIIFTIFCFIVLINGTNFIDGTNLNTIGYYIIVYSIIFYLSNKYNLDLEFVFHKKIILFLLFLYILNFLNKTQLGDSGSYLIGFFTAFYIIEFVNSNNLVSPYFAVLLLWYPCFENLFSILRKIYQKKSISSADNLHLHHSIYLLLKIKNFKFPNNMTGLFINLINFLILILGAIYFNSTIQIIIIISISILGYVFLYNFLIRYTLSKKFIKNIK
mgnify:FL=1